MECSENWKQLKQELKAQSTENKHKRKRHPDDNRKIRRKKNKNASIVSSTKKMPTIVADTAALQSHSLNVKSNATETKEDSNDIWFDTNNSNVRDSLSNGAEKPGFECAKLVKPNASDEITKIIGMDCTVVGVGEMKESVLARVSIVNRHGVCVYDKFVKTKEPVTDYRTNISGVTANDMENAEDYEKVQQEVSDLLLGRILVGHSLYQSLKALFLTHPSKDTRDTARQSLFKSFSQTRRPSLRVLSKKFLDIDIQKGRRDTVENAQAAMKLFIMHKRDWGHIRSKKRYKKVLARKQNSKTS